MHDAPDDPIATERLILEPLRLSHAEEMVSVLADDHLYEHTGGDAPALDALADRYRRQIDGSGRDDERWFNWIARRTDTGGAVGYVQATVIGEHADVAWLVGVDHQRRGFAGEAAEAMLTWLTRNGVRRFSAHVAVDHVASARVAEHLGMQRTGTIDDDGEEVWSSTTASGPRDAT